MKPGVVLLAGVLMAVLLVSGCTETGESIGRVGETKYVCEDGSTVSNPNDCFEASEVEETLPCCGNVYTEADVASAINRGKLCKDEDYYDNFFMTYVVYTQEGWYSIFTPYIIAVNDVKTKFVNYDEISESLVRQMLTINQLAISVGLTTEKAYYSWDSSDIRVLIKDGDKIYRAGSLDVNSEMDLYVNDLSYKTTISASGIPNYEDFAKKTVDLIIVISGKEIKYTLDMSKFK